MTAWPSDKERASREGLAIKCPLCGHTFTKGAKTACETCPLHYGTCHFEKCPHCGYDIPVKSMLADLARKVFMKLKGVRKNDAGNAAE